MATIELTIPDDKFQDVLRGDPGLAKLLEPMLNQLLQAEMTEHLEAKPGERTDSRRGYRNGTYERKLTTRVGTLELEVPRDREGTFDTALFQRYQRSEKALVLSLMQMVVQGVSTRRVKKITTELCGREFSRSTVSRPTEDLEKQVQTWAKRPLDQKYPFLVLGCPCTWRSGGKGRSGRRPCFWPLASARTASGRFWGFLVALSKTGQAWERLIDQLKERGLSGVEVATSDAHEGLKQALQEAFPGLIWQRCQFHFRRNVMDQTPASYKDRMDQVVKASSQQEAQDRFDDLRGELAEEAPSALEVLEGGLHEATAVLALPDKYRKRLRTTKRDPAVHPGGPPPGKTDSDLSKRGVGSSACWGPLCRDPRGVVDGAVLLRHGRVFRVEGLPS